MNISYQNNGQVYSNNDIFADYFNAGARPSKMRKAADACLAALSMIIAFFTAARTRTVARATGFGLCLVSFIGIIGAMEAGAHPVLFWPVPDRLPGYLSCQDVCLSRY